MKEKRLIKKYIKFLKKDMAKAYNTSVQILFGKQKQDWLISLEKERIKEMSGINLMRESTEKKLKKHLIDEGLLNSEDEIKFEWSDRA